MRYSPFLWRLLSCTLHFFGDNYLDSHLPVALWMLASLLIRRGRKWQMLIQFSRVVGSKSSVSDKEQTSSELSSCTLGIPLRCQKWSAWNKKPPKEPILKMGTRWDLLGGTREIFHRNTWPIWVANNKGLIFDDSSECRVTGALELGRADSACVSNL